MADNKAFWDKYNRVNAMLKRAFVQIPGGQMQDKQAQDPAAGGGMPPPGMDPNAGGGMPPPGMDPAAGGMPPPGMDPAAGGMPPPGMDPSMMGGMPPPGVDPAMAGMVGAGGPATGAPDGGQTAAPGSPMITISLDQLFEIIQKVLGLAKKVGVGGSGLPVEQAQPSGGLNQDQLKATIYEALGSMIQ